MMLRLSVAGIIVVLVIGLCVAASDDCERIYEKARQYEEKGHYATAIAAYQVITEYYPQCKHAAEAKRKLKYLREKIQLRSERGVSKLASVQAPDLVQGRSVKTAVQMGISLTSSQEANLVKVTENLMTSMGVSPSADLPAADRTRSGVPIPAITSVYCPPLGKVGEPIFMKIVAKNLGASAREGGITVSFPDKPDYITVMKGTGQAVDIKFYPQGSNLYSGARASYIVSTDPMIETYQRSDIASGKTYSLSTILIPDRSGILRLYIRTALRGKGKDFYNYPSDGPLDQQSYNVLEYPIYVRE